MGNEDLKKLCAKTGHSLFVQLKTALTAAKKWEPSFDKSLSLILKKCKICTHHSDIIDSEVTHFNDFMQVETIKSADENTGHILMTDLFYARGNSSKYGSIYGNRHILLSLGRQTAW